MSQNVGWIKQHRSMLYKFSENKRLNSELWLVYHYLTQKAAFDDMIDLNKGQVKLSARDIQRDFLPQFNHVKLSRMLNKLAEDGSIKLTPLKNKKSGYLIEICQYDQFYGKNDQNQCNTSVTEVLHKCNEEKCSYIEERKKKKKEELNTLPDTDEQCRDPFDEIILDDQPNKTKKAKKEKPIGKSVAVINAYREAFYERYQSDPIIDASVRRQACTLVDRVGQELAENVVRFYLTHNDRWYLKKAHEFKFCLADCKKLCLEMEKNCYITDDSVNNFLNREKSRANSRFRI